MTYLLLPSQSSISVVFVRGCEYFAKFARNTSPSLVRRICSMYFPLMTLGPGPSCITDQFRKMIEGCQSIGTRGGLLSLKFWKILQFSFQRIPVHSARCYAIYSSTVCTTRVLFLGPGILVVRRNYLLSTVFAAMSQFFIPGPYLAKKSFLEF